MPFAIPSMAVLSQFGANAVTSSTPSAATKKYEWISATFSTDRELVNTSGIRGKLDDVIERLRNGKQTLDGNVKFQPTPTELRFWLPLILGGAESAQSGYASYALANSKPYFQVILDYVAKVYTWTGCKVDKAVFSSTKSQPLQMDLDICGLTETLGNAGTFASLTIAAEPPFVHFDSTVTLAGSAVQVESITLTIDNMLKKDRFVNSQTRTDLPETGRKIMLKLEIPYTSDTAALYDPGVGGVTCDLKWSLGGAGEGATGTDLRFVCGKFVAVPKKSPAIGAKADEILLVLDGQLLSVAEADPLSANLDYTP